MLAFISLKGKRKAYTFPYVKDIFKDENKTSLDKKRVVMLLHSCLN